MDYSYLALHDRQEGRPAPENGRAHPQNQYPVHCEHQQYPTGHQVMSTGYPSSGFASYVHPIQAPITSANAGIPSQEGLHPPRMMVQDSTSSSSSISSPGMPFRTESRPSTHLQQILHSVALQPNLMQSDAVFHNLGRSAISQPDPSRTSSGHSSHTVSSSGQSLVAEVRPPNPRPRNPEPNFRVNRPVVSQHVTTQNAQTASPSSRPGAVGVSNRVSDVSINQQESVNPPSVNRPLQENLTRPPVASSVSSGSSEMDSKSCQTEPLFDMLPVAARTLSSSFDLIEGFSYKMTGHEPSPGVVVTKDLQEGDEFGPFTGEFVDDDCGIIDPTSWEVCVRGKPGLYISGTCDPNNWMTHVQVARCREEQNMEAFQFYGDIFFRMTKAIEAGTELRVFYSKDYKRKVGFTEDLEDLKLDQGSGQLECRDCLCHYSNAKSLLRHVKFEHDKENFPVTPWEKAKSTGPSIRLVLKVKQEVVSDSEMGMESSSKEKEKRTKSSDLSKRIKMKFVPPKMKASKVKLKKKQARNRYSCSVCRKQFPSEGQLEAHSAFHKEVKASKRSCDECGVLCQNAKMLKQHKISHNPDAFQCHLCQRYFRLKRYIVYHLRHNHKVFEGKKWSQGEVDDLVDKLRVNREDVQEDEKKRLKHNKEMRCVDCKQSFEDKEVFEQHQCTEVTYKCQYCDEVFQKNSQRVSHLRQVHKVYIWKKLGFKMEERLARLVRPEDQAEDQMFHPDLPKNMLGRQIAKKVSRPKIFKCKYCPKTFTEFNYCSKHEKQVHTFSGQFMCEFCSASFTAETNYLIHKTKHTQDRLYKCGECPLSFSSEGALARHIKEHRGEYPHKCDVCTRGYLTRKQMMEHKRRVHRVTTVFYQCQFCPKKLKNKETCKAHEKCHKGIRPYMCLTCSKAFRDSHSLKRHILTHTGEKPLECKLCHERFRVPQQLFKHMIIYRNDERHKANTEGEGPSGQGDPTIPVLPLP